MYMKQKWNKDQKSQRVRETKRRRRVKLGEVARLCLAQATWPAVSMKGFSVKKKEEDDVMEDWDLGE